MFAYFIFVSAYFFIRNNFKFLSIKLFIIIYSTPILTKGRDKAVEALNNAPAEIRAQYLPTLLDDTVDIAQRTAEVRFPLVVILLFL